MAVELAQSRSFSHFEHPGQETPLLIAVAFKRPVVATALIGAAADPNLLDVTGKSPLMHASGHTA